MILRIDIILIYIQICYLMKKKKTNQKLQNQKGYISDFRELDNLLSFSKIVKFFLIVEFPHQLSAKS